MDKVKSKTRKTKRPSEFEQLLAVASACSRYVDEKSAGFRSKTTRDAASQLSRQMQEIHELLFLPIRLLIMMRGYVEGIYDVRREIRRLLARHEVRDKAELLRRIDEHIEKSDNPASRPEFVKESFEDAFRVFFLPHAASEPSLTVLLSAALIYTWTAFECLASDLWVAALNHNPRPLAQSVLGSLETDSDTGLSSRHIQVGLAAKHGFDLRHCLGTLLKPRFDFSSVPGITDAYERAFGKSKQPESLKHSDLRLLEQMRHLIVHRGGAADARFRTATKVRARLGSRIRVKPGQVHRCLLAALGASMDLLHMVENWISSNRSPSRASETDGRTEDRPV